MPRRASRSGVFRPAARSGPIRSVIAPMGTSTSPSPPATRSSCSGCRRDRNRESFGVDEKGATAMTHLRTLITMTAASLLALTLHLHAQPPQRDTLVWAPVPKAPNKWLAPNKPHTKLADLVAAHNGQASWREPVVRDPLLVADYVQMAPGDKTRRQF